MGRRLRKLLASLGFEALATTSAGLAWSLGKLDGAVTRDELVAHVATIGAATPLPLNVDSERCYPDDPGGVAETVALLAEAGAAGFSIEDYDPATGAIDDVGVAVQRVAVAATAAHGLPGPLVLTARCENHIRDVDDFEDTLARLRLPRGRRRRRVRARPADIGRISRSSRVGPPVNVLALKDGPSVSEFASVGVRRVSTGGALAAAAYGALVAGAQELQSTGSPATRRATSRRRVLGAAFG